MKAEPHEEDSAGSSGIASTNNRGPLHHSEECNNMAIMDNNNQNNQDDVNQGDGAETTVINTNNYLTVEEETENNHHRVLLVDEEGSPTLNSFPVISSPIQHQHNSSHFTNASIAATNQSSPISPKLLHGIGRERAVSSGSSINNTSNHHSLQQHQHSQANPSNDEVETDEDAMIFSRQLEMEDERQQLAQLSTLEQEQFESLKLLRRKHRQNYLPDSFINFCKSESSKVYGWGLESEKHSAQSYSKSISIHFIETGDPSVLSRISSQSSTNIENTSTQDLSKYTKFKITPHDATSQVIALRFVGVLSNVNYRDAFEAYRNVELRKQTKQMEEAAKLEDFYEPQVLCDDDRELDDFEHSILNNKYKPSIESFDVIYQRTYSPSTLISKYNIHNLTKLNSFKKGIPHCPLFH